MVYPKQGVYRVTGLEQKDIAGQRLEFVKMTREEDGASVLVPLGKVATIGLRRVASADDIEGVFHYLGATYDDPELDWKVRHRDNVERLIAGGVLGVAEVVKGLHSLSRLRPLPAKERELYDSSRHLLVNEISVSLGVPDVIAEDYIDYALMPPAGVKLPLKTPPTPVELKGPPWKRKKPVAAEDEDDLGLAELGIDLRRDRGGRRRARPRSRRRARPRETKPAEDGDEEDEGVPRPRRREAPAAKAAAPAKAALRRSRPPREEGRRRPRRRPPPPAKKAPPPPKKPPRPRRRPRSAGEEGRSAAPKKARHPRRSPRRKKAAPAKKPREAGQGEEEVIRIVTLAPFDEGDITFLSKTLYRSFGVGTEHVGDRTLPRKAEQPDGRFDALKLLDDAPPVRAYADDKVLYLTDVELANPEGAAGRAALLGLRRAGRRACARLHLPLQAARRHRGLHRGLPAPAGPGVDPLHRPPLGPAPLLRRPVRHAPLLVALAARRPRVRARRLLPRQERAAHPPRQDLIHRLVTQPPDPRGPTYRLPAPPPPDPTGWYELRRKARATLWPPRDVAWAALLAARRRRRPGCTASGSRPPCPAGSPPRPTGRRWRRCSPATPARATPWRSPLPGPSGPARSCRSGIPSRPEVALPVLAYPSYAEGDEDLPGIRRVWLVSLPGRARRHRIASPRSSPRDPGRRRGRCASGSSTLTRYDLRSPVLPLWSLADRLPVGRRSRARRGASPGRPARWASCPGPASWRASPARAPSRWSLRLPAVPLGVALRGHVGLVGDLVRRRGRRFRSA